MTSAAFPPPAADPTTPQPPAAAPRPLLRRSGTDRMLGGVCGGLAEHLGIDALLWRIGIVALTLAGGSGILVYLLLWVLMPPPVRAAQEQVPPLDRAAERLHEAVEGLGRRA
jgi:phage shock protein C